MNKNFCIKIFIILSILLYNSGCVKWMIRHGIDITSPIIISTGIDTFLKETDIIIAESAVSSNIKILELLIENSPDNQELLNNAAFGLSSYGISFVEYEMEKAKLRDAEGDEEIVEFHKNRAIKLYLRGRNYGFKSLCKTKEGEELVNLLKAKKIDMKNIKLGLKRIKHKQISALFWSTVSWASLINISRENVSEIAFLPVLRIMIERIKELDPSYFFGMPHLFDAMLFSVSPVFGGDEKKAKESFERLSKVNNDKFLMSKVFKARFFCSQFDYPKEGKRLLKEVIEADTSGWPEKYNLLNIVAKRRASLYLKYADEIF